MQNNKVKLLSVLFTILLVFSISIPQGLADNTGYEPENPGVKPEQTAEGDLGMVVTAHPLASKVGADVLKQGGNAVDAAVAIQFALNVNEPMMSGIGGGSFLMYYDADDEDVSVINSRERAPDGATPDMFMDKSNIVTGEGNFLLSAIEQNNDGGGRFHIGDVTVDDLDNPDSDKPAFHYNFEGEEGTAWDSDKFDLDERGANFTLDDNGGLITFGDPVNGNKTSFGRTTPVMEPIENSELQIKFRTDDPGDDRRLRLWLRADEYRTGSTFAKNGYGIEIDTKTNELKLIQSKDATSSTLGTVKFDRTTDWQSLRFQVNDDELKLRMWEDNIDEPEEWDLETVSGTVMPFSDRVQSGKSVGVPGTLKGLETANDEWGTMSLKELIQPSIEMAEEGVAVNWVLADAIESNQDKLSDTAAKDVFMPEGKPLEEGDLLVQNDLAKTFRLISKEGVDALYGGEIGEALVKEVEEFDSSMMSEDLQGYDVTHDTPVWGDYLGYDIASMAPPSSGGLTALQLLKMFEDIDLTQYDVRSTEKYHYMAESMHLAYADRGAYMGDPEYVDVPGEGLLDPDYVSERVKSIDSDKANSNVQPGDPWKYQEGEPQAVVEQVDDKEDGETTHFTVADQWGNLVSNTTTIEQLFGSGIMVPGYGVMLNNELTDFDATPGGSNEIQPNKRPLSSMTPSIIFKDDKPFMTVGSPGGATIITSVAQTIVNVIGYDMDLKDAIEEPRIYSDQYPSIRWEHGIPDNVRQELLDMGHSWEAEPQEIGNVNSILLDPEDGQYMGAADSTREGVAIGVSSEDEASLDHLKELVTQLEKDGEITDQEAARLLQTHLTAVAHYEDNGLMDKAVKHLNRFKQLITHQKEEELLSEQAFNVLMDEVNDLLSKWDS